MTQLYNIFKQLQHNLNVALQKAQYSKWTNTPALRIASSASIKGICEAGLNNHEQWIRTQKAGRLGCSRLCRSGSESAPRPSEEADAADGRLPAARSSPPPCAPPASHAARHTHFDALNHHWMPGSTLLDTTKQGYTFLRDLTKQGQR